MRKDDLEKWRVFQTASLIWLFYVIVQAVVDLLIYFRGPFNLVISYYLANGIPVLLFLILAHVNWNSGGQAIRRILMIFIITISPILINSFFKLRLPEAPLSNLEGMMLRQLPVMMLGLIMVAWHYPVSYMIVFSVAINVLELAATFLTNRFGDPRLEAFYFIILIRTACFLVVGIFVNQLIAFLRTQQMSLRIANQKLATYANTLENLATSRERNRMSRELHDTVVHSLSGLAVQLETIKAYIKISPKTAGALVEQSLHETRNGLQETRRALKALRASPLEDLGLLKALQQLTSTAAERAKFNIELSLPSQDILLSPEAEQCIYRIAQEAVENVIHHANAKHLMLMLKKNNGKIELIVKDDGDGFILETNSPPGHFGISGMYERARISGGELSIVSKPNNGTTVNLLIAE
jgi:signal transduction histidine kinase